MYGKMGEIAIEMAGKMWLMQYFGENIAIKNNEMFNA